VPSPAKQAKPYQTSHSGARRNGEQIQANSLLVASFSNSGEEAPVVFLVCARVEQDTGGAVRTKRN
jgi:hypothetical protein